MPKTPFIDKATARQIGFAYIMQQLTPGSPYGRAAQQALQPYLPGQEAALRQHLQSAERLLQARRDDAAPFLILEHQLCQLPDWRLSWSRLAASTTLDDVDFLGLKQLLYWQAAIRASLSALPHSGLQLPGQTCDWTPLQRWLDPEQTGSVSFYLADAYSPRLAQARRQARRMRQQLQAWEQHEQQALAQQLNLRLLPSGEMMVPRQAAEQQQLDRHPSLARSRVTPQAVYYRRRPTAQETAWADELAALQAEAQAAAAQVRTRLTARIRPYAADLQALMQALGQLDLLLAQVRLADELDCTCPCIVDAAEADAGHISFSQARHPQVAARLAHDDMAFQPINLELQPGATVITGANMGGKTVTLHLAGLLVTMAQHGFLVPAAQLTMPLLQGVRCLAAGGQKTPGLSRFGSEMHNLQQLLPLAKQPYLLLYDELASGTNPVEGAALAQAVVEHVADLPSFNLFATHYAALAHVPDAAHWQVRGLSQVDAQRLAAALAQPGAAWAHLQPLMDYRLQAVAPGQSLPQEALRVASALGLPTGLLQRASQLAQQQAKEGERKIDC